VSFDNEILTNTELKLSDVLHDIRYDTFSEVEKNEIREKLFKAIDSLKNEEKALIIATEFEGESFKELSEKWDEPLGTLLSRKSRALNKLKKILNQYK
jgi:RNA polymerase sigma factor (sigma-70 family)